MKKLVTITALAVFLVGCGGGFVRSKVERGIRNALPQYVGPAEKYTVRVDGSSTDMMNGFIKHLHIEGTAVQVDPKLLVSQLVVDMDEVRYNSKRELTSIGKTIFGASVTEGDINRYLAQSDAKEYNIKVRLTPSQVQVSFMPNVLGVNVAVTVAGKPEIVSGSKVNFVADSASAAHLPVPAFIVNQVLANINPILDMSEINFPIAMEHITIKNGSLNLGGRAEFKPSLK